jgi:hypothetical protein
VDQIRAAGSNRCTSLRSPAPSTQARGHTRGGGHTLTNALTLTRPKHQRTGELAHAPRISQTNPHGTHPHKGGTRGSRQRMAQRCEIVCKSGLRKCRVLCSAHGASSSLASTQQDVLVDAANASGQAAFHRARLQCAPRTALHRGPCKARQGTALVTNGKRKDRAIIPAGCQLSAIIPAGCPADRGRPTGRPTDRFRPVEPAPPAGIEPATRRVAGARAVAAPPAPGRLSPARAVRE